MLDDDDDDGDAAKGPNEQIIADAPLAQRFADAKSAAQAQVQQHQQQAAQLQQQKSRNAWASRKGLYIKGAESSEAPVAASGAQKAQSASLVCSHSLRRASFFLKISVAGWRSISPRQKRVWGFIQKIVSSLSKVS